jgi:hypothetical protein
MCGESPNVATSFYKDIERYSRPYKYKMFFPGVRNFCKMENLVNYNWPVDSSLICTSSFDEWRNRKRLVSIVSNKRKYQVSYNSILWALKLLKKTVKYNYDIRTSYLKNSKDLYAKRLETIVEFAKHGMIDLFGQGWDKRNGLPLEHYRVLKALNPISINSKYEVLKNYQFSLCFENCEFPGYITEKVFDSFQAGCIPIYMGAPDISSYVPPNTFIDFRNFKNINELIKYIRFLQNSEMREYLENINHYLNSDNFNIHDEKIFASEIFNMLQGEVKFL